MRRGTHFFFFSFLRRVICSEEMQRKKKWKFCSSTLFLYFFYSPSFSLSRLISIILTDRNETHARSHVQSSSRKRNTSRSVGKKNKVKHTHTHTHFLRYSSSYREEGEENRIISVEFTSLHVQWRRHCHPPVFPRWNISPMSPERSTLNRTSFWSLARRGFTAIDCYYR